MRAPQVPDYYEIVQEPIDLRMIADRIDTGDYYITLEARNASAKERKKEALHSCVIACAWRGF